jgi:hypothetical protein
VHEEESIDAEDATASTAVNPVSIASTDDIDIPAEKSSTPAASTVDVAEDPGAAPNDSSDGLALGSKMEEGSGCDNLAQGLIGLIEYSYHQGIPSFSEAYLQRTLGLRLTQSNFRMGDRRRSFLGCAQARTKVCRKD